jgi:radical SAM protein with 4Fe4S-binding SPASM domain
MPELVDVIAIPPPSFLSFEPTNYCNLKCPACPSGSGKLSREKGFADIDVFKNLMDENRKQLINLILHFQGEPLLHKELGDMISYARESRIFTELSTNANLFPTVFDSLKNNMPDKIIISLDGLTQDTYNKYRVNGDISKVFEALKLLSQMPKKKRPFVEVQFLVFSHNEVEIPKLKKIKLQYKIDKISLKTAQIYEDSQISILPKNEKHSRYKVEGNSFKLKSKLPNYCRRIIFGSVITWDGKLVPCCFDKDAEFVMGDIKQQNLNQIRNADKYRQFIKTVFSQREKFEMCRNCSEGLEND